MKILVSLGLGDSLIECLIRPITQLEQVQEVLLVRTRPGLKLPKVRYYCPPQFMSKLPPLTTLCKLFILLYLSIIEKPDLIHSFLMFPHGIIAFAASKLTRKHVSITLNAGPVELYGIGGSPLGINFTRSLPWFGRVFLWMLKRCSAVLVINSPTKEFLISHGISDDKIYILPQPVNTDKHHPMPIPKRYDVVSVGRLAPVKHIEVLFNAIAAVKRSHSGIRAGIVGDGPSRNVLEKLAIELGISQNVEFLGFSEDTPYYYNSAKTFALTSEREGGPLTFTEAMACGIPPVTSQCGIVTDVGKDGINCIIIPDYTDANAFARAIVHLLEDNELYYKLSQNAIKTALSITMEDAMQVWGRILEQCQKA